MMIIPKNFPIGNCMFSDFLGKLDHTATKTAERRKNLKENIGLPLVKNEKSVYSLTARENAV
jgi:hypothetical protein